MVSLSSFSFSFFFFSIQIAGENEPFLTLAMVLHQRFVCLFKVNAKCQSSLTSIFYYLSTWRALRIFDLLDCIKIRPKNCVHQ